MNCTKKAYDSKEEAKAALKEIQSKQDGRKKPTRAYTCLECKKVHLTSMTAAEQNELLKARKEAELKRQKREADQKYYASLEYRVMKEAEYFAAKNGWEFTK